jgi:hypothetical protein
VISAAERSVSAAAGSGSDAGADAGGSRLHTLVRRGGIARDARATPSPHGSGAPYTMGWMFWLRRQKFIGS